MIRTPTNRLLLSSLQRARAATCRVYFLSSRPPRTTQVLEGVVKQMKRQSSHCTMVCTTLSYEKAIAVSSVLVPLGGLYPRGVASYRLWSLAMGSYYI